MSLGLFPIPLRLAFFQSKLRVQRNVTKISVKSSVFSRSPLLLSRMKNVVNSLLSASYFSRLITTSWDRLFWLIIHLAPAFSLMVWSTTLASGPTMAKAWLCVCSSSLGARALTARMKPFGVFSVSLAFYQSTEEMLPHPQNPQTLPYCAKEIHHHVVTGIS